MNLCYVNVLGDALDWPVHDPWLKGIKPMAAAKKKGGKKKKKSAKRKAKKAAKK